MNAGDEIERLRSENDYYRTENGTLRADVDHLRTEIVKLQIENERMRVALRHIEALGWIGASEAPAIAGQALEPRA